MRTVQQGFTLIELMIVVAVIAVIAIIAVPSYLEQIRKGRTNAFGFLVGQVMKASKGKANPKIVNELLAAAVRGAGS